MTAHAEGDRPGEQGASHTYDNVTCPFCGLLCDDLQVTRTGSTLKVSNGCPRAAAGFQRPLPPAKPLVVAARSSFEEAMQAAAGLIRQAKLPLYGGMASDVAGARAVLSIADRTCGVLDHALSEGQYRNFRVVQTSGWIMSTLTEVRNRADLIVIVGYRRAQAARPLLRSHRDRPALDVRRRGEEAHRGLHRRRPRHLRRDGPHIEEVIILQCPTTASRKCSPHFRRACAASPCSRSRLGGAARQARRHPLALTAVGKDTERTVARRSPVSSSPPSIRGREVQEGRHTASWFGRRRG